MNLSGVDTKRRSHVVVDRRGQTRLQISVSIGREKYGRLDQPCEGVHEELLAVKPAGLGTAASLVLSGSSFPFEALVSFVPMSIADEPPIPILSLDFGYRFIMN